jgi:UDP-glucose 4-epimerase
MSLTDATVLVTGGAGFIGSHLVAALAEKNEVRVLDDLSTGHRSNLPDGVQFIHGDVRDTSTLRRAMVGVDVVFHEAALVSVAESVEQPERYHATNATGTLGVLEAARRGDARVVVASSAAVYGHPSTVPVPEDALMRPSSPYGVSKLAADAYTRMYALEYGLETVALRYFNVYGPGQRAGSDGGVVATFVDRATRRAPLLIEGDGSQTRDFVHVSDVVRANLAAATTDATGRAFNVGTGEATTITELTEHVRALVGNGIPVIHTDPRAGDIDHSSADLTRVREELGYEPTLSLREGLASFVGAAPTQG